MNASTFGKFTMSKHENVLIARLSGHVDLDTMIEATKQVAPLVKSMEGPWASLMDYTHWELYTEETIGPLVKFQEWAMAHGHAVEVAVVGESYLKKNARETLLSFVKEKPQQVYVETEPEAWDWLVQNGYCEAKPNV
jgi:hypothetical protein